ncbi:hypothetical protein P9112_006124 [Eukaryota sp. TZLM1-RC]
MLIFCFKIKNSHRIKFSPVNQTSELSIQSQYTSPLSSEQKLFRENVSFSRGSLIHDILSYRIQLANANQQLTAAEADQNQLQDHNQILTSELQKLRDESTAPFEKLSQRETQIKELEAELQSANALVTKSQLENADLRAALQNKEKKIFTYKNQLEEEITVLNQRQLA